jgi:hypothetical protein
MLRVESAEILAGRQGARLPPRRRRGLRCVAVDRDRLILGREIGLLDFDGRAFDRLSDTGGDVAD